MVHSPQLSSILSFGVARSLLLVPLTLPKLTKKQLLCARLALPSFCPTPPHSLASLGKGGFQESYRRPTSSARDDLRERSMQERGCAP